MQITRSDIDAIEREFCRRSLANFAARAWPILEPGTPMRWGWAVQSICEHLEAVSRGEITRLLMNVPPGTMKSLLTSVIWPAWEWGPLGMQSLRYLGTAHMQALAVRDSTKCRRLIQSPWFQRLWPVELTSDQNAKTKFENSRTGFREAMAFGSMTGARGDRVILDDPHSVDDANSPTKLKGDIETFREALPSRVNNDKSSIVIIMQRLAVGDVSDVALELGYQHLLIPMEYESGRSVHAVGSPDPRTKDGELMFPDRFTRPMVDQLKLALGSHATAGQLQQRPTPRGGGVIKSQWLRTYDRLPPIEYRTIYADTAQKTEERHDYSVFACWGKGIDGNIYLIDQIRDKWEAPDLEKMALAFWAKHNAIPGLGKLRRMMVEDKASGTGLIQSIKRKGVPVKGIERSRDKYSRVMDGLPEMECGRVWIPAAAPFTADFIAECEAFTADDSHKHDDQIDPMMDAIQDMLGGSPPVATAPIRFAT